MKVDPPVILVVDDDRVLRRLVAREIQRLECGEVIEAADGREAQVVLDRRPVDLVVTDVVMPELDGLGLMRWAKEKHPEASWIILSGLDTFDAAVEAIQLGAFDFLSKPPEIERLRLSVRNALAHLALVRERERLVAELEQSNLSLSEKVDQLEDLCRLLERQAAVIQRDLERAEVIQRALLPRSPPPLGSFRVETLYRPGHNVGGDLYDLHAVDERHVVLLIADASGHGVSSAMLSVLFKHHLRTRDEATGAPVAPAQALAEVDEALSRDVDAPGMFITAVYGLLDKSQGELRLASAGHLPVLCQRAGGDLERLERTGPALGVGAGAVWNEHRLSLARGDRLLFYTDGALGSENNEAGLDRISAALGDVEDSHELLARLEDEAAADTAPDDRDDLTAILLEAREGTSRFDSEACRNEAPLPVSPTPPPAEIRICDTPELLWLRFAGRATWTAAEDCHAFASEAIAAGQNLRLDFSDCRYLDSTFLGTIHELVSAARERGVDVRLQGVSPELRALFDELCMERVLEHIDEDPQALPAVFAPLPAGSSPAARSQRRVLRAHELLASLSERNREEFRTVIEALRREIESLEGKRG